jgi:hypothetical protein
MVISKCTKTARNRYLQNKYFSQTSAKNGAKGIDNGCIIVMRGENTNPNRAIMLIGGKGKAAPTVLYF